MRILNLLSSGGIGGIEVLCKDIAEYSKNEHSFAFLFARGEIFDEMQDMGKHCIDLSSVGKNYSIKKLVRLFKVAKDYDIIVSHHGSMGMNLYFRVLMLLNKTSRYVMTCHSCFEKSVYYFKNPIKTLLRKKLLSGIIEQSDHIVYVSEAGRKTFVEAFSIDIKKTDVVYNGISPALIKEGKNNVVSFKNDFNILYIGRLAKVKGLHLLLGAVKELKDKISIRLTVVGDGEQKNDLQKMSSDYQIDDIVSFEGSQRNIRKYLEKANVFVYPSTWQEVFGISIVEAMAFGIPCVANRVGGIPEIVFEGRNGYLAKSADANAMAASIMKVYQAYSNGEIEGLTQRCKSTASRFTVVDTVKQLDKIYESIV